MKTIKQFSCPACGGLGRSQLTRMPCLDCGATGIIAYNEQGKLVKPVVPTRGKRNPIDNLVDNGVSFPARMGDG